MRVTEDTPSAATGVAEAGAPTDWSGSIAGFSGHGFWRQDRDTGTLTWWDSLLRDKDPKVLDAHGQEALRALVHPDDIGLFDARLGRAFELGEESSFTFRFRRPEGWRVISCHVSARADADGRIPSVQGMMMDITEVEICRVLAEEGNDLITQTDESGVMTYISPSVEKVTGYRPEELVGRPITEVLGGRAAAALEAAVQDILVNPEHRTRSVQYATRHRDGRVVWLESRLIPMIDPKTGERIGVTDVVREITERKLAEDRLENTHILLKTLIEASPGGILLVDNDRRITSYNQRFCDMWSVTPEEVETGDYGHVMERAASLVKDEANVRQRVREISRDVFSDSQDEIETIDGRWIDRYTVSVNAPDKGYLGRAWFFRDVTDHRQALTEAVRMARYDHLTGLANRAALAEALQRAIARGREREESFAVFCLDLDSFKDVNDTLGHLIGDQLLVAVADRLRCLVSDSDLVARPGGDEFAVVSSVRTATEAAMLADKFIREVSAPYLVEGHQIYTSVSIGIDLFGSDECDARTLLSHADMALYQAKAAGAGTYRFFTEAMDTEVRTRVTVGAELREAIETGQLFLLYQPEVELATGRIIGTEALVRWRHPRRGVLGPDVFVPVAEQTGLIGALGRWVLWTAARQAQAWADAGISGVRMGVNVSALQFKTPAALEADISAVLSATRLPPELLELELTETALMTASGGGDILKRLHQSGVRIAIDDFGTGYSSLDYLRRFPAGRIKIAQTFVRHLGSHAGDAAIVKAIIGLARELGMSVIAEGVETPAQFELLRGWGCSEAQGYLFDRPLNVQDATRRLNQGGYRVDPVMGRFFGRPSAPAPTTARMRRAEGGSAR
jgi:diguanylate cyclase (GGDEF)-like protein/PAS domain S-box-containing protein